MTSVAEANETEELPAEHDEHEHPSDKTYWVVGGVLAALTALEVSTYWWPDEWHKFTAVTLIIMMIIKFALVALFFMHLRFDDKMLRRIFFFGLALALAVYIATLSAFVFWDDSGNIEETYPAPPRAKPIPPPPTDPPPVAE